MTDEWLYFACGFFLALFVISLLFLFEVAVFKPRRPKPGIFTWRRLPSGEEEVILDDGRVYRGKGIAWYQHPDGTFAPDWLSKWLSEQSKAAKAMSAVGTGRRRFVLELEGQKRREKRYYGDN